MKILKILFIFVLFVYALVFFLPKKELFYLLENYLKTQKVFISHESLKDQGFALKINNGDVIYEEILLGSIKEADINIYLFSNSINIKKASFVKSIANLLPQNVQDTKVSYTILDPLNINIVSKSDLGDLSGAYNLKEQKLKLNLKPSQDAKSKYSQILREFKNVKGVYSYEKLIKLY